MSKINVLKKLYKVQQKLKAPKNQFNSFAKFKYRSCEDILEAVKPILNEVQSTLIIKDDIIVLGEEENTRFYIKAVCIFTDILTGESIESSAVAREVLIKKGMDDSQITGSTSSYARKYALNGLFAIDDNKDADTMKNENK